MPRFSARKAYRCNIAATTDEDYFRAANFIPFLDNFIFALESKFTAHKAIIGGFQCLFPANLTVGPTIQQTESIQVLGKFYENSFTKSPQDLVLELTLWFRNFTRLDAAKRPTDALNCIKECSAEAFPNIFTLLTILLTLPSVNVYRQTIFFHITQAKNVFTKYNWYYPNEWTCIVEHLLESKVLSRRSRE